jgi:acetyl-CoA acetyltransferase family protein
MMPQTAQNIADMFQLTRESCDAFALNSHKKYQKALSEHYYDGEITALTIEEPVFDANHKLDLSQKGPETRFAQDECFRPGLTLDQLSELPALKGITSYEKAPLIITPGNSCPTNDGFAASLLLTEAKAEALGIQPMARIIGFAVTGIKPQLMGLGPVSAIKSALAYANVSLAEVDFMEFNEAFAAQVIACMQELSYPLDQVNLHGGSLAIGHPLGATGVRLVGSCARQLAQGNGRYAVAAQCIGAGMGIATVLERIR